MPSLKFQTVLDLQRARILQQFVEDPRNCWIGARTHKDLDDIRGRFGGRREALLGFAEDEAFVWLDDKNKPECWVKTEDKEKGAGTYTRAWMNFCLARYGATCTPADLAGMNVDHLYPETAAYEGGVRFVRAMPVKSGPNQSAGSIEKAMKKKTLLNRKFFEGKGQTFSDRDRLATLFSIAKVVGVYFPAAQLEKAKQRLDAGRDKNNAQNLYNIVFEQLCAALTAVPGVDVSEQLSPLELRELMDGAIEKARWMQKMPKPA